MAGPIQRAAGRVSARLLGYYTEPPASGRPCEARRAGAAQAAEDAAQSAAAARQPVQSPLKLSRVHWVRPEVVVEVSYLTWTEDNLLG